MAVPTQFTARIENRAGNFLGDVTRSIRVWLDRGLISVSPKQDEARRNPFKGSSKIRRCLSPWVWVLFLLSGVIGAAPSLAETDAAGFISDLGSRALAAMQSGNSTAAKQGRFRQLFRQYFDVEACARAALGPYWKNATAQQRQEFVNLYEDYVVIGYSAHLGILGGDSFKVLGSQPDKERVIVASRIQINGAAPIRVDWQLNSTNHGYKVTDLIVNGVSMAGAQHSDMVSVIQRNNGHVSALLVAMREKNASNGIVR